MADKGKAKNITDFKVEKRDGGDLLITINDPEIVRHISEVAAKVFSEYANDIDPDLVYASTRAVNGKSDDKREASGSDKRYSFRIMHPSDTLHVFEGAIDLLSYMTLTKITDGKWTREAMVSLGGVASSKGKSDSPKVPIALQSAIENMKNLKRIMLHLDRDDAGRLAAKEIMRSLQDRFEVMDQPPKFGKDMNDYLIMRGALNDKRLE